MLVVISFFLTVISWKLASAQTPGRFINPPNAGLQLDFSGNLVLTVGNTLQARWSTTLEQYSIWLWQQSLNFRSGVLGSPIYSKIYGGPEQGAFNWTVTLQAFDLLQSNVFFFALGPTQDISSSTVTSHYFNLTVNNASSGSIISSSTSSTVTSSISHVLSSTSSPAPSNSPKENPSNNTTATRIGLGVGISLGIPLLLLAAYLLGRLRRRRQQDKKTDTSRTTSDTKSQSKSHMKQEEKSTSPHELHADDRGHYINPTGGEQNSNEQASIAELGGDRVTTATNRSRAKKWTDGRTVVAELGSGGLERR